MDQKLVELAAYLVPAGIPLIGVAMLIALSVTFSKKAREKRYKKACQAG